MACLQTLKIHIKWSWWTLWKRIICSTACLWKNSAISYSNGYYQNILRDNAGNIVVKNRVNEDQSRVRGFLLGGLGITYRHSDNTEVYGNISQLQKKTAYLQDRSGAHHRFGALDWWTQWIVTPRCYTMVAQGISKKQFSGTTEKVQSVQGTINICSGDQLTITAPSGFTTYTWSNGASTNPITINTSTNALTLQVSNGACMSPPSDPLTIAVNPLSHCTHHTPCAKGWSYWLIV